MSDLQATTVAEAKIDIYSMGPCAMSVCAPQGMTGAEVAAAANEKSPTGIQSQWAPSEDPTFQHGETNPCACNGEPLSRLHWLLSC